LERLYRTLSLRFINLWDSLIANKNNKSLRKIADKLTPRIILPLNHNNKTMAKPIPACIEKILSLIPAKSQKEVNQISKYLRNTKPINGPNMVNKLYAQASKQSDVQISKWVNNTTEVIKIKDIFSTLNAQKIDQIHKIINSSLKPKQHIQMTTKGLSRKQVIILMSIDNINSFMKSSSLHVTNINWSLRNTKSEVLVNFIQSDTSSVTVIMNKVTVQSDLHIIENYVKKVEDINIINVDMPCLPQSKFYLKIIGIPYFSHNNSNKHLTPNNVEGIIKHLTMLSLHRNCVSSKFHLNLISLLFGLTFGMFKVVVKLRVLSTDVSIYCYYSRSQYESWYFSMQELLAIGACNSVLSYLGL